MVDTETEVQLAIGSMGKLRITCLSLDLISEHFPIQVEQVICHGLICPLMYHRCYWIKPPARNC